MPVNAARRPVAALRLALCAIAMIVLGAPVAGHAVTTSISGFDPATQDRIARAVATGFLAQESPGHAVGIWRADGSHYVRAFGVSNRQTGEPLQVEDRFRVGSLTKTMTAVTVLRLVDQGRLSLDDRLSRYVPGIGNGDLITVRQLLAMRAGVYDFTGNQRLMLRWWKSLTAPWTPAQTIAAIRRGTPQYPPGTQGRYDNSNYEILGRIIEVVTGRDATQVIRDEVIVPAGLTETTLPTSPGMPGPFRRGYTRLDDGRLRDTTHINPIWPWTAGMAVSTLADLRTWSRVLASGSLISAQMQAEQRRGTRLQGGGHGGDTYGLGMAMTRTGWWGHTGYVFGYNTAMYTKVTTGTTIVVTGNDGADAVFGAVVKAIGA